MKLRGWIIAILASAFLLVLLTLAWVYVPRLETISPLPDSQEVAVTAPLRLTFSRPLRDDEIPGHLVITPARRGVYSWEGNVLVFQPSQPWPGGTSISVRFTPGARAQGFWGLPLLRGKEWTFHTRQALIVYLWPSAESADLYTLDPFTGQVTRLTSSQNVLDFSLGLYTRSIYYSVSTSASSSAILRLDWPSAGTVSAGPEIILECSQADCRTPRLSPNGDWLAYEHTPFSNDRQPAPTQVWLLSLTDRQARLAGDPQHTTLHPVWSARGWLAFYDNERQGYLVQEPPGKELAFLPGQVGGAGVWNPSGNILVAPEILVEAISLLGPRTTNHLIAYELDTNAVVIRRSDLTLDMDLDDILPFFSQDGSALVFARQYLDNARWTPGRQLWWRLSDGSQFRQLTNEPFYNHYDFSWSPDGQRLAYVRFNQDQLTESPELWIINVDGSNPIQLVKRGFAPQWIP